LYHQRGNVFWIKYYRNGKPYSESTHNDREATAKKLLKTREGEIGKGELPGIYFDKVRFEELAEGLITEHEIKQRRSLGTSHSSIDHLKEYFGGMRVVDITTDGINKYIQGRLEKGYANGTVNRELGILKHMFKLGVRSKKVRDVPYIPMLKESNARQGFFEHDEYLTMKDALPTYAKPVLVFGYHTGWRIGEILKLTWDRVDLKRATVRLNPEDTKNKEARELYLTGELLDAMHGLQGKRQLGCPYVFHVKGNPISYIRFHKAWETTCQKVKLQGKLFHDCRRTATRNLTRAGVTESVAMKITGHKTNSIFKRYNIVDNEDLKNAMIKQEEYIESLKTQGEDTLVERVLSFEKVTKTVTLNT
jgi:integrase